MQVSYNYVSDTQVELDIEADSKSLNEVKKQVLTKLAKDAKLAGFRVGKAPLSLVEKNVDQTLLQKEFLEEAINKLYIEAITSNRIRPVEQPQISVTKFVPFTTLDFKAVVECVGKIKLADYKNIKIPKKEVKVTSKDIEEVIARLKIREAEKKEVKRPAQNSDEVWIDFTGQDMKTKELIQGASGNDYPLVLGSKTFIPGFEDYLVGLKPGDEKNFDIVFPDDYSVAALQKRSVSFKVKVKKVKEVVEPEIDDKFAAKVGPFKKVNDLKDDIKKQLELEKDREAQNAIQNEVVAKVSDESDVVVPERLIEEQLDFMERDERQNLVYRGQTWEEHLKAEGINEEEHRARNKPQAAKSVKAGLVLNEIAEKEKIIVTPEELEIRLQALKDQYSDPKMQVELDKPSARQEILNRLLTEKTLAKLTEYFP